MLYRRRALQGAKAHRLVGMPNEDDSTSYVLDALQGETEIEIAAGTCIEVVHHDWIPQSGRARVVLSDYAVALIRWQDWEPLEEPCGDPEASLAGPWGQRFTKHTTIGDALQWNPARRDMGAGDRARMHRLLQLFDGLVEAWRGHAPLLELLFCGHFSYVGHLFPYREGINVAVRGTSNARLDLLYNWLVLHWQGGMIDCRKRGVLTLFPAQNGKASLVPGGGVSPAFIVSGVEFDLESAVRRGL